MNAGHATALHGMSAAAGSTSVAALPKFLRSPAGIAACLILLWILGAAVCLAAPPANESEFRDKTPHQPDNTLRGNSQRANNDRPARKDIQQASGERRMPGAERDTESASARDNPQDDTSSSKVLANEEPTAFAGDDVQKPRKLPERDASKRFASSPTSSRPSTGNVLWSAAGWLSIIVAAVLISGRFLLRNAPSVAGFLPPEAMQVLGRRTLAPRFSLHLVRCGRRILIIGSHPQGLTSLGEVTDPAEVDHLAGLCTPSPGSSPAQTFAAMFSRFSTGAAPQTNDTAVAEYTDNATVDDPEDTFAASDNSEGFGSTTGEAQRYPFGTETAASPLRPFAEGTTAHQLRDRLQQRLSTDPLPGDAAGSSSGQLFAPAANPRDRSRQEPRSA